MRNYFVFNGKKSSDYGAFIDNKSKDDAPERDIESIDVPGRNGTLTVDNGRYKNVSVPYTVYINEDFANNTEALRDDLLRDADYHRLEDTIHPDEYRMAKYYKGLSADTSTQRKQGYFELVFDCMPQRFLKRGEKEIELSSDGIIYNPTGFEAKPLLRIYGVGTVKLNNQTIVISTANTYTDVDCEILEAYRGDVNCNANVVLDDDLYLTPGKNAITLIGVSKLIITPRWWRI